MSAKHKGFKSHWAKQTSPAPADDIEIFDTVRVYTAQGFYEKESFERGIVMAVTKQDDGCEELIVEMDDGRRIMCNAADFNLAMDRVCWPVK